MNPTVGKLVLIETDADGKSSWIEDTIHAKLNTRHYLNKDVYKSCIQLAVYDGIDSYVVFNEYLEPKVKELYAITSVENGVDTNIYRKYKISLDTLGQITNIEFVEEEVDDYTNEFKFLSVEVYSQFKCEAKFRMLRSKTDGGMCIYLSEYIPKYLLYLEPQYGKPLEEMAKGELYIPYAYNQTMVRDGIEYPYIHLRIYWRYNGYYWWIRDKVYASLIEYGNSVDNIDYRKRWCGRYNYILSIGGTSIEPLELNEAIYAMPYYLPNSYLIVSGIEESTCLQV